MKEFPPQFKDKLCWELGCQGYNASIQTTKRNRVVIILLHHFSYQKPDICCLPKWKNVLNSIFLFKSKANLETSLSCSSDHNDIKHCVVHEACEKVQPAEIYCNGKI